MGVRSRSLVLFLLGIGLGFVGFFVQQFHCLDCGTTGWLYGYRHHACPMVVARYESREVRHYLVPRVPTQVTIWFYVLLACFLAVVLYLGGAAR
jgi:hypothetical protein